MIWITYMLLETHLYCTVSATLSSTGSNVVVMDQGKRMERSGSTTPQDAGGALLARAFPVCGK